jgi:hypothetical protein
MQLYIILVILLSPVTSINMIGASNERPKTRLRVVFSGYKMQLFLNPTDSSAHNTTAPVYVVKMGCYPLMRVRFALSQRASRVFVSSSHAEDAKLRSLVRVYVRDLVCISFLNASLITSLTHRQGISNFAILALVITNIWGGWMLQQPRWL